MSDPVRELVIATKNAGKLVEIRAILADLSVSLRSLDAFPKVALPDEVDDYETNAVAKARAAASHSGRFALGDDSGIEVDALGGAPGPRSARYGGPDLDDAARTRKLLDALRELPDAERGARFVCVAALATPTGGVVLSRGECRGRIATEPQGSGGFGYDPVFLVDGGPQAMAELPAAEKNLLSHRGHALRGLWKDLERLLGL